VHAGVDDYAASVLEGEDQDLQAIRRCVLYCVCLLALWLGLTIVLKFPGAVGATGRVSTLSTQATQPFVQHVLAHTPIYAALHPHV
jgi:hypothetical protein